MLSHRRDIGPLHCPKHIIYIMVSNDYSFWRTFPLTLALVVTVVTSRLVASKHGNSSLTCDNFRLPPLVVDSTVGSEDSDWHNAPPAGFGYGNWKFAYASNPQYQFLYNLQVGGLNCEM